MNIIKPGKVFNFTGNFWKFGLLSISLVILSILSALIWPGVNLGIDFAGGMDIHVKFRKDVKVNVSELRGYVDNFISDIAKDVKGDKKLVEESQVQHVGATEDNQFLIRMPKATFLTKENSVKLDKAFKDRFKKELRRFEYDESSGDAIYLTFTQATDRNEDIQKILEPYKLGQVNIQTPLAGVESKIRYTIKFQDLQVRVAKFLQDKYAARAKGTADVQSPFLTILRVESVSPKVGEKLRNDGILSLIYAWLFMLIYIAFRFEFVFAPGAIIALIHDIFITLGFVVVLRINFSLVVVAAFLTIIGYSINDTIIIYDRIRENRQKNKDQDFRTTINIAISETLNRTLITSGLTLFTVIALWVFGIGSIQDFAACMSIGIITGTYSSICIACPIVIWQMKLTKKKGFFLADEKIELKEKEPQEEVPEEEIEEALEEQDETETTEDPKKA